MVVAQVGFKRGDMLNSESIEQRVLYKVAEVYAQKADLNNVKFVVPDQVGHPPVQIGKRS